MFDTPVLLIVFNRPAKTRAVLEQIKKVKPAFLYVAADGPRAGIADDIEKCAEVGRIIDSIDWGCQIKTLLRKTNLGCKEGVSSAITWFFDHVTEGIILEDDVMPNEGFFHFCRDLLEEYRNDNRVMLINGSNFHYKGKRNTHSYRFSRYPIIWGWATWRRAWQCYDIRMTSWPELRDNRWLHELLNGDENAVAFWTRHFTNVHEGGIDTWDYQWVFSVWRQNGLAILPQRNLVRNIGFGADATHTTRADGAFSDLRIEDGMQFPLTHPPEVAADPDADAYLEKVAFSGCGKKNKSRWRMKLKRALWKLSPFAKAARG